MKKIYLFVALFFVISSANSQCMLYPVSLQTRINNSSLIIHGKVISSKSFWNSAHNNIFTSNLISVNRILKGNVTASFIEIITRGGVVDLSMQTVDPSLQLDPNEEGVFMLNTSDQISQYGRSIYQAPDDQQSFIKFNLSENTALDPFKTYSSINGELLTALQTELNKTIAPFNIIVGGANKSGPAVIAVAGPTISSFLPASLTAGTASVLTITGVGFGVTQGASVVRFADADVAAGSFITPHATQYLSWSDTQIMVEIPTRTGGSGTAGTGNFQVVVSGFTTTSASPLTITYGHLNVLFSNTVTPATQIFNSRHHNTNGIGGMTWRMQTAFDANASAKADWLNALGVWRCQTKINWPVGLPTITNTVAIDGINVVGFDNAVSITPALPGGVLAVTQTFFSGCVSGTVIAWYVAEHDMVFGNGVNWHYGAGPYVGTQYDFKSVALHELGHAHQLSHIINSPDVMHYSIASNQTKFTLSAGEIAGGTAVMNRNLSGAVCGNSIMIALTPANCALTAPTSSFNLVSPVCANSNVALNSLATGGPTNWNWVMTSGVPATSTLQNTSTTYAGPGTYTITLTTSNGIGTSAPISKTISVIGAPTIAVTSGSTCQGGSVTLTANGAASYTWFPGGATGSVQAYSPPNTQAYSVIGSNGTCTNVSVGTITVVQTPTLSGSLTNTVICVGETTTITAVGATNYTINPGGIVANPSPISPTVTTTYTVLGQTQGCVGSPAVVTLTVDLCTGANALKNSVEEIKIYPNPTQGAVTIDFNGTYSGKLCVFNSLGQMLMNKTIDAKENAMIDLGEYSKGIYIIRLSSGKKYDSYIKVVRD